MKEINFIAFLGLYLVISPQAAGQESGSLLAKMVIERQVSKSDFVQRVCKKYPFPKRQTVLVSVSFPTNVSFKTTVKAAKESQPVVVNVRKFARPKIIEEHLF